MSGQARVAAALGLSAAVQIALRFLGPLVGGADAAHVYTDMILRQLLLWGLPGLMMRGLPRRTDMGLKPMHALAALLAGAAGQYALARVTDQWQGFTGAAPSQVQLPDDPLTWLLALLALVIVPAVAEELFFRHGLMRGLEGCWSSLGALMAGAAVFALMHGSLAGLPAQLGAGLLLGLCFLGTGSLPACMLLHGAYNGCALWWSLCPPETSLLLTLLAAVAVLAIFCAWMLREIQWKRGRVGGAWLMLLAAGAALAARLL